MQVYYHIHFKECVRDYTFLENEFFRITGLRIEIDMEKGELKYNQECFIYIDEDDNDFCLSIGHLQIDYLMSSFVKLCMKYGGRIDFEDLLPPWALLPYKEAQKYPGFVLISTGGITIKAKAEFLDPENLKIRMIDLIDGMFLMGRIDSFENDLWFMLIEERIVDSHRIIIAKYMITGYKIPDFSNIRLIRWLLEEKDKSITQLGYLKETEIM